MTAAQYSQQTQKQNESESKLECHLNVAHAWVQLAVIYIFFMNLTSEKLSYGKLV